MDTLALASLATELATTTTQQAAQLAVLKKAMELQGQGAIQLVQAATQSTSNPPNLGNNIDVFA
jgi:Putative motility protein